MDIPFISSGALNTTHYALVRHVELSSSTQEADNHLLAEVDNIKERLARSGLTTKQCKEYLILLLYCSTTISTALLAHKLDFALPHAVNLAAAGASIHERRIGYLFCAEVMSEEHELQLMLVNTLRKDLESQDVPTIALALDHITQRPSFDIIPAISARLLELLLHPSPLVRRRALLCSRALSGHDPSMLNWLSREISKRLRDKEPSVVAAALRVCPVLHQNRLLAEAELHGCIKILQRSARKVGTSASAITRALTRAGLELFAGMKDPPREVVEVALDLIARIARSTRGSTPGLGVASPLYGILLQSFHLLQCTPFPTLSPILLATSSGEKQRHDHPIAQIRYLLASSDPNERYTFLACLGSLDPRLWAGIGGTDEGQKDLVQIGEDAGVEGAKDAKEETSGHIESAGASVLEPMEIEMMMGFLEGKDEVVRLKTLRILKSVDPNIITSYLSHSISLLHSVTVTTIPATATRASPAPSHSSQSHPQSVPLKLLDEATMRTLDVVDVLTTPGSGDGEGEGRGETYAGYVREVLGTNGPGVLQKSVEKVLKRIRDEDGFFAMSVATTLLSPLSEMPTSTDSTSNPSPNPSLSPSPSLMIILTALACSSAGQIAVAPKSLIQAFGSLIGDYSPSVQETCLFAMLRFIAELPEEEDVTKGVVERVRELRAGTGVGRYILKRYDQFLRLCVRGEREVLRDAVRDAGSRSLPDFLVSLEAHSSSSKSSLHGARSPVPQNQYLEGDEASVASMSPSMVTSKLRYKAYDPPPDPHLGLSRRGMGSRRSSSRASADTRGEDREGIAMTITAGDLARLGGSVDLRKMGAASIGSRGRTRTTQVSTSPTAEKLKNTPPVDLLGSRADLISLDSPFLTDPPHGESSLAKSDPDPFQRSTSSFASLDSSRYDDADDKTREASEDGGAGDGAKGFESSWNELDEFSARGWCEVPVDGIVRRLQGMRVDYRISVLAVDQPPFEGELKVLLSRVGLDQKLGKGRGALRLRESEEESCLWRLRSDDEVLLRDVKKVLGDV